MLDKKVKKTKTHRDEKAQRAWNVECSTTAKNCRNYIREIVDTLEFQPHPDKKVIALSIGDPTVYGNLLPSPETILPVIAALESAAFNGYAPSIGHLEAREALARYLNDRSMYYTAEDVILCSGCSSALEISITALCDAKKKHNLLVPRPGFSIYRTLAEAIGVKVKYYDLIPERKWEIDLDDLKNQIDSRTAAIVLNNPSNPCGSVYTQKHLEDLLEIADSYRIPIIADEIYERLVFPENVFVSVAGLKPDVPTLVCGGLAKRFLVPGWRIGWIAVSDPLDVFRASIRRALLNLSQRTIGCNTSVQGALPAILFKTPQSFHDGLVATLESNSRLAFLCLSEVGGLKPYLPQGAMYMMVGIDLEGFGLERVSDFIVGLMEEESVFCLPGTCFQAPDFMRIVLTVPEGLLLEACNRILYFCNRRRKIKI